MDPLFVCAKCKPALRGVRLRRVVSPISFHCGRCKDAIYESDAYMLHADAFLICAGCKKRIRIPEAHACPWCFDIAACSMECWRKIAPMHMPTCTAVGSDVCAKLGIEVPDKDAAACCGEEVHCGSEEDEAVGSKSHHSSSSHGKHSSSGRTFHGGGSSKAMKSYGGSGRMSGSSSHYHRHPSISPQKAHYILREGQIRGNPLTGRQQRLFGYLASRKTA